MNVSEVRVGVLDAAGTPIEVVYTKNDPLYAVYRTSQRVMIHLADDVEERKKQQETLALLNPLRNEINALIDGWRTSAEHDKEALTRLYDRRIADALTLAMENDPISSKALLKSTLDEIGEERQSRGRIEHLLYAAAASVVIGLLVMLATSVWDAKTAQFLDHHVNALLFAAAIGAVGALVSIGIAVRERQLKTDLQTRDNVADAVLRVTVGAVGALLLIAMMRADLIDVDFGNVDLAHRDDAPETAPRDTSSTGGSGQTAGTVQSSATTAPATAPPPSSPTPVGAAGGASPPPPPGGGGGATATTARVAAPVATDTSVAVVPGTGAGTREGDATRQPQAAASPLRDRTTELLIILVLAFFAGFSERIVKQLAERMRFRDVAADLTPPVSGQDGRAGGGRNGSGVLGATEKAIGAPSTVGDADDHSDGCLADYEVADEDATDDTQLPAAAGGVEDAAQSTN